MRLHQTIKVDFCDYDPSVALFQNGTKVPWRRARRTYYVVMMSSKLCEGWQFRIDVLLRTNDLLQRELRNIFNLRHVSFGLR